MLVPKPLDDLDIDPVTTNIYKDAQSQRQVADNNLNDYPNITRPMDKLEKEVVLREIHENDGRMLCTPQFQSLQHYVYTAIYAPLISELD